MKKNVKPDNKLRFDYNPSRALSLALPSIYVAVLGLFCLVYHIFPGPEFIILCFLLYAAYNRWTRRFVKDWVPFVTLLLAYEAMYSIAGSITGIVHVTEPLYADLSIFGSVPTLVLQQSLRSPFLDVLTAAFYSLHFIAPTVFAFVVWRYHHDSYWKYTISIAICTYAALVTFLLYPVAPPWYGISAPRVLFQLDHNLGVPVYRTIFEFVQANPFAAFPSLHSAYPWMIALYSLKLFRNKAIPVLMFPLGVWFSTIYLGEHYVIDVIGGIAYATIAFLFAEKVLPRLTRSRKSLPVGSGSVSFPVRWFYEAPDVC